MDDLMGSLLWDNATRDLQAEQAELARTAALADVEKTVWPLVALASSTADLGNRLALAEPQLLRIAAARGYAVEELQADLVRRWELLDEAQAPLRAQAAQKAAQAAQEAQERQAAWDAFRAQAIARMASRAAMDNPGLPMARCLELAEAAAERHLPKEAANPLAYSSWQHVVNGPFMQRIKNWRPGRDKDKEQAQDTTKQPPAAPAQGDGGPGTFDEVHKRLDDLDNRVNPKVPSQATPGAGNVPDLDLSDLTQRVDRAAADDPLPQMWENPMHRLHRNEFADRRLDHVQQTLEEIRRGLKAQPSPAPSAAPAAQPQQAAPRGRRAPGDGQQALF